MGTHTYIYTHIDQTGFEPFCQTPYVFTPFILIIYNIHTTSRLSLRRLAMIFRLQEKGEKNVTLHNITMEIGIEFHRIIMKRLLR